MTQNAGVVAEGRWADQVSLGVLASSVPRDVIDDVVAACGRGAKRSDGKLPPHVMVYFAMALALFAEDDYEEVAARLAGTLSVWKCWDARWGAPTSGGITRARERLGFEPLAGVFARVAVPVADLLTRGAFVGPWRLMAIDGLEWEVPDTPTHAAAFGYPGGGKARQALIDAARNGEQLDKGTATVVRVIEYQVPDRDGDGTGELIALITTITDPRAAPASLLAEAYHQRWEHETGNAQLKTCLRGPGRVLRSKSPDMLRQEIYGSLLTHHAISALICQAATEADIDPDRVKFTRTVRIVRRAIGPADFPPC